MIRNYLINKNFPSLYPTLLAAIGPLKGSPDIAKVNNNHFLISQIEIKEHLNNLVYIGLIKDISSIKKKELLVKKC